MKAKGKAVLAAVFLAAGFSACSNVASGVYGPPPEKREFEETDTEAVSNDGTVQTDAETDADTSDDTEGDEQR